MNIAVYLGSNFGNNSVYRAAVVELGKAIGQKGHHLVYGGSKSGLMGLLAQTVLANGGTVTGVEPRFFVESVLQLENLTELIVTDTMQERKAKMMELAEMYIAFPGGTGTAEEISEVIAAGSLGHHEKCYGYYNVDGFYDLTRQQYDRMVEEGFLTSENRDKIRFWRSIDEIFKDVDRYAAKGE